MYHKYNPVFKRDSCICSDINIFENSEFSGFFKYRTVEKLFSKYYQLALESAKYVSWDYIVLYAIIEYKPGSQKIISAHFMTFEMPYGKYMKIVEKYCKKCRFFFLRGRKEYYNE